MTTHFIQHDEPMRGRGRQQAACGAIVDSTSHYHTPSCHACQDVLASLDETIESLRQLPADLGREPRRTV